MHPNNKKKDKLSFVLGGGLLLFIGVLFLVACSPPEAEPVIGVEPSEVCMVNDTVMAKPQIPVPFEGKTYYGCCEGCVGRLQNERAMRFSRDPLTGREVDKAKAFIIPGSKGEALYFESSKTAGKYMAKNKPKERRK